MLPTMATGKAKIKNGEIESAVGGSFSIFSAWFLYGWFFGRRSRDCIRARLAARSRLPRSAQSPLCARCVFPRIDVAQQQIDFQRHPSTPFWLEIREHLEINLLEAHFRARGADDFGCTDLSPSIPDFPSRFFFHRLTKISTQLPASAAPGVMPFAVSSARFSSESDVSQMPSTNSAMPSVEIFFLLHDFLEKRQFLISEFQMGHMPRSQQCKLLAVFGDPQVARRNVRMNNAPLLTALAAIR